MDDDGQPIELAANSFHDDHVSPSSDGADSYSNGPSPDSNESIDDDYLEEPQTVSSRIHESQAPRPSSMTGSGLVPTSVLGTQNTRTVGDDSLRSISASISDDLSRKEKVEIRQLSALIRPLPSEQAQAAAQREAQAAAQREAQAAAHRQAQAAAQRNAQAAPQREAQAAAQRQAQAAQAAAQLEARRRLKRPEPGWTPERQFDPREERVRLDIGGQLPPSTGTGTPGDLPEFFDTGGTQSESRPPFRGNQYQERTTWRGAKNPRAMNPPGTVVDTSHNQRRPKKRPRSELRSRSAVLQKDLYNLNVHELEDLIVQLDQRAKQLGSMGASVSSPLKYEILYRIAKSGNQPSYHHPTYFTPSRANTMPLYFDPPQWTKGQDGRGILRSQLPVTNFDLYLERNKDISFIVYKTYSIPQDGSKTQEMRHPQSTVHGLNDAVVDESIQPVNKALVSAIEALLEAEDEYASILESFQQTSELKAPYLFVFHQRNEWETIRQSLSESSHQQLTMLWDYIVQSQGEEYAAADSKISNGMVTAGLLQYLFKPGQVLVQRKDDEIQGWMCADWPRATDRGEKASKWKGEIANTTKNEGTTSHSEANLQWELSAWHWEFDGEFRRKKMNLLVSIEEKTNGEDGIPINTLGIFPLKYASDVTFNQLRCRGRIFWKCRKRALVSYRGDEDANNSNLTEERYMIDLKTYRILHDSERKASQHHDRQGKGTLESILPKKAMEKERPPNQDFLFLLPPKIKGFNLRTKKWFDLVADRINDVKWNKDAFSKVVIEREYKDLISALVSNQLESEKNTDLIEGKGNGLILLLHGGPGTGKTLTAESVAETAEKPLYRVTCGDVGTKAEEVEKYLESVLYLGKLWGCVVLLDEADIFLQQRNLEDLQRNALVSVFLRVLEYYEGILILTSNRVGTFDEAFKSRIQLAIQYPDLDPLQRYCIWQNFFDRLESIEGEAINLADLRHHLHDLKNEAMNGRQIRNAITTARQYARWKETTLDFEILKKVIGVSGRFDKYLTKLHGGLTEGQLAEDEGLRLGGED